MVQVETELERLREENAYLHAQVAKLTARIAELEERLSENSTNSSRPPSSDPPEAKEARRKAQGKARKRRRKRGGQRGHKGHERKMFPLEMVDEIHEHFPTECENCEHGLLPKDVTCEPFRRQVVEIPEITPHVKEHRVYEAECPSCGEVTKAQLPEEVPASPYGPRLLAVTALLTGAYGMSRRSAQALLSDVLGIEMSLGALSRCEQRVSDAIAPAVEEAYEHVKAEEAKPKHVDATSWRMGAVGLQLWVIATSLLTVFKITADGKTKTVKALLGTLGLWVTDRGSAFMFWVMHQRQICWAHLIRKFVSFSQSDGPSAEIGLNLLALTAQMFKWWHRVKAGRMKRETFIRRMPELQDEVIRLLQKGAKTKIKKLAGSCKNILKHREALWTFVTHDGVEPTNNHAEQQLRALVQWRKKSFGSQSERGCRYVERVMTVVHSLRKQSRNVLRYLVEACSNAQRRRPPPSILPQSQHNL